MRVKTVIARHLTALAIFLCPAIRAEWLTHELDDDRLATESALFGALELQYTPVEYPKYVWRGGDPARVGATKSGGALRVALEWIVLPPQFGKLGVGTAASSQQVRNVDVGPGAVATLNILPIELYSAYRFDYVSDQALVPFVRAGGRVSFVRQFVNGQNLDPSFRTVTAWDYGAGLELCLDNFDKRSSRTFDRTVGVNATFLTAEYVRSTPTGHGKRTAALAHQAVRAGLRFEF